MINLDDNQRFKISNKFKDKSVTLNVCIIQCNDSIVCGFYCITFIEYIIVGKIFARFYQFIFT